MFLYTCTRAVGCVQPGRTGLTGPQAEHTLTPRRLARSSHGLQQRMLSGASIQQKRINYSRHGTHCFDHQKAGLSKPFTAHDLPVLPFLTLLLGLTLDDIAARPNLLSYSAGSQMAAPVKRCK
ncbi:hypothetical protein WJX79_004332 [Trebouxia sp. C0005]